MKAFHNTCFSSHLSDVGTGGGFQVNKFEQIILAHQMISRGTVQGVAGACTQGVAPEPFIGRERCTVKLDALVIVTCDPYCGQNDRQTDIHG